MTERFIHIAHPLDLDSDTGASNDLPQGAAILAMLVVSAAFWGGFLVSLVLA